jgi:succinoglycan biosynthesis transport protein ExoP
MATNSAPENSFRLSDAYYILFRHKWKILICTILGLGAAGAYFKLRPPPFQSEARLFVRFVITDGGGTAPSDTTSIRMSPDSRGATILDSELQIITSWDLAQTVARNVGPEKILAGKEGNSLLEAAMVVRKGLIAEVPRNSSTIEVAFLHPDAEMAQTILREYVSSYLKRHVEIHRAAGMVGEFLAQETDQLRARLAQTEEELRKVNARAGVVSLEESKQAIAAQIAHIRQQTFELQVELAGRTSIYEQMTKLKTPSPGDPADTAESPVPPEQVAAYQKLVMQINQLRTREQELLNYFKEGSSRVLEIRNQLNQTETQRQQLVTEYPGLTRVTPAVVPSGSAIPNVYDPLAEAAQITAVQARIKMLVQQMELLRTEAANLDQLETSILELRRRKELEEANYRRYAASLEQSRIKEAMGDGKVSNISVVQSPTPAYQLWQPLLKMVGGIAAAGLALGLAWALLIEFFLDHSLRRPADVERLLRAPLFIAIPRLKLGSKDKADKPKALPAGTEGPAVDSAALPARSVLEPYHQTLRDRLISYFDSINLRHKPKLIAVTGLGRGSGVTTTAAGLARSLSETGEGNVLLVDMTQGQGSAHHFQRGSQVGLDQLLDTRNSAFVRDNLYVVSEHSGSERLAKGLPQRFNQLVPKLKASDFDYIIFDMPPVNQISITPRLAGFMDMTLLVVESEKTDRHVADRAIEMLAQSKTNVGVLLNKNTSYVPAALHQDREFLLGI